TPMSAQQFMELLFGKLPEFFKDEAELRELWSAPDTRKKLLTGLADKGFGHEQLAEMQKIIHAEKSDLFDVLAYVAYTLPPLTREERAARAKIAFDSRFTKKQQAFLDFVLAHYVQEGVDELGTFGTFGTTERPRSGSSNPVPSSCATAAAFSVLLWRCGGLFLTLFSSFRIDRFRQRGQFGVRLLLFLQGFLEQVRMLVLTQLLRKRNDGSVTGYLIVLNSLGAANQSHVS